MENLDSTEHMIAYLARKKFDHIILYHNSYNKQLYNDINPGGSTHRINIPQEEFNEAHKYVKDQRISHPVQHIKT